MNLNYLATLKCSDETEGCIIFVQATNGESSPVKNGVSNGDCAEHNGHNNSTNQPNAYTQSNEDVVRIIGQHLLSMGLS